MYVGDGTVIRSREVKPSYRNRPPLRDPEVRKEVPAVARTAERQDRPLMGAGRPTGTKPAPSDGWSQEEQATIHSVTSLPMPVEDPLSEPASEPPSAASSPPVAAPFAPEGALDAAAPAKPASRSAKRTTQAALLGRIAELEREIGFLATRLQALESSTDPSAQKGAPAVAQAYVYTGGQTEVAVGPVTVNRSAKSGKAK